MGDRNNIKITYSNGQGVYLYSHWGGSELREIVADALETSGRVTDESYFARVLFSRMIAHELHQETGYGIAPYVVDQDASNKMIHVDYTKAEALTGWVPQVDYRYEGE